MYVLYKLSILSAHCVHCCLHCLNSLHIYLILVAIISVKFGQHCEKFSKLWNLVNIVKFGQNCAFCTVCTVKGNLWIEEGYLWVQGGVSALSALSEKSSNPGQVVVCLQECTIQTKIECIKKPFLDSRRIRTGAPWASKPSTLTTILGQDLMTQCFVFCV